ncbi:hypothetical protein KP509_18G085100 [Ceratopteris richardii]|uniref:Uncharacterized protein n=1 Tax=Ceratopteris richardii TaxID=49495 RepID=A0A8T2SUW7_CERRI|nr:hypothetical protein KP509_18G085100 [Ceratopteris richardii]
MCYEVKCSKCGKTSWGGCGLHVKSVYNRVPEGQRCFCKSWPGVAPAAKGEEVAAGAASTTDDSSGGWCTIM